MSGQYGRAELDHLDQIEKKKRPVKTLFDFEHLIFPVCYKDHFVVVSIKTEDALLTIYDSTQGDQDFPPETAARAAKAFQGYIAYHDSIRGLPDDSKEKVAFHVVYPSGLPRQQNGTDCGLYAIDRIAVLLGAQPPRLATSAKGASLLRAQMLKDFICASAQAMSAEDSIP